MRSKASCVVAFASLLAASGFAQRPQLTWSDLYNHAPIPYRVDASSSLLDDSGNLYVINAPYQTVNYGVAGKLSQYTPKVIVEQYAPSGSLNWRVEWRHPQAMSHNLLGAALDTQGRVNLFVHVGRSVWRSDLNRLAHIRISPSGEAVQVGEHPLPLLNARGFVRRSASGDFYVVANPPNAMGPMGGYLTRLSETSDLRWTYNAAMTIETLGFAPDGSLRLSGVTGGFRLALRKIDSDGVAVWNVDAGVSSNASNYVAVGVAANGNTYAIRRSGIVEVFSAQGALVGSVGGLLPSGYSVADAAVLPDGMLILGYSPSQLQPTILIRTSVELIPEWQVSNLGTAWGASFSLPVRLLLAPAGGITVVVNDRTANQLVISRLSSDGALNARAALNIPSLSSGTAGVAQNAAGDLAVVLPPAQTQQIMRISAANALLFTATVQHTQDSYDVAYRIAVDLTGNSVLTRAHVENNYFTYDLSYSASGVRRWNEPGLLFGFFDSAGNWISAGWNWQSNSAARVIKRAPNGQLLWNRTYSNVGSFQSGVATAGGAFYLTARSIQNDFLHRFAPDGTIQWTRTHSFGLTEPIADGAGGVFLPSFSGQLMRYDSSGALLWTVDAPTRVGARGADDTLYTLGIAAWSQGWLRWRITRVNADGVAAWQREFETSDSTASPLVAASDAAVYVVMCDYANNRLSVRCLASATGALLWERAYNLPADQPQATADAAGNLYLAFRTYADDAMAVRALKFAPDGEQLWAMDYAPRPNAPTQLMGLAVDSQSRVLLTGETAAQTGDSDIFIAQFRLPILGDANNDGCVDEADLLLVLFDFGGAGAGDLNGDGVADDADLLRVLFQFGAGC
ncbi:MAG: hypothetical protein NZM28_09890 [Fimbriimonadales bacterium]|nr:hypothetical protein [Fimbriimonadales bacterium]